MTHDRFKNVFADNDQAAPTATATAFVPVPAALQTWGGGACPWEQVYRLAYEKARAVTRPSIVERLQRDLLN